MEWAACMHTACINDFYDESNSKRKVNTMTTTTNNMDSNNMNNGTANGGSTPGASSDGDLDFQGKADAAEKGEKGCGLQLQREADREPRTAEIERGSPACRAEQSVPAVRSPQR